MLRKQLEEATKMETAYIKLKIVKLMRAIPNQVSVCFSFFLFQKHGLQAKQIDEEI